MTDTVKDEVGASLVISYLLTDVPVCDSMSGALNSHWALITLFKAVTRSSLRFNLGESVRASSLHPVITKLWRGCGYSH